MVTIEVVYRYVQNKGILISFSTDIYIYYILILIWIKREKTYKWKYCPYVIEKLILLSASIISSNWETHKMKSYK